MHFRQYRTVRRSRTDWRHGGTEPLGILLGQQGGNPQNISSLQQYTGIALDTGAVMDGREKALLDIDGKQQGLVGGEQHGARE